MPETWAGQVEVFRELIAQGRLRVDISRAEVREALGEPTDTGCTSRRYRTPSCFRYGQIEIFFNPRARDGLTMVYTQDPASGEGVVLLKA